MGENVDLLKCKKIGLFFGSFNPITIAHLMVANFAYQTGLFDEIWLVVSPANPFKRGENTPIDVRYRFTMVELSILHAPFIKACGIEMGLSQPNYTINTLNKLTQDYPSHTFTIVCGEDVYFQTPSWKSSKEINDRFSFLVYRRMGDTGSRIRENEKENVRLISQYVEDTPILNISSTMVRNLIKNKKTVNFLVHDSVKAYIELNKLYN